MLQERTRFIRLCVSSLESKGLSSNDLYKDRLKKEIKEIDAQGEHEYLLALFDKFKQEKLIFPSNEHNLLVYYLLNLSSEFDIEKEYAWFQGEMPDVDIDYVKDVRDYLKRTWAPKKWGQDFICEIGTYGTSGIKSSILDMARVHNLEKNDIQAITVTMEDKDDEGKVLEWDKALEMYSEFKSYCDRHPQVAEAARLLLDRNRTGGVHAGGLIISSVPIDGFVPLEVRSVNKVNPNGVICSAWAEGLNTQDLQPVGLIKFDMLVINNLMQIAIACKLVKERHGLTSISALPGSWDWSDLAYLNDPKSIEMANNGDLKCIFQFDGEGIRKMVKRGGVTGFDDEAAYSALYRPGPLNCFSVKSKIKIRGGEKVVTELTNWHDEVAYINKCGEISYTKKFVVWKTGKKKLVKIRTKSGKELFVSADHRILAESHKFKKAETFKLGEKIAISM